VSVRILILIGTVEGLQIADELTRQTNYEVFIFLDKRSRIKTSFNIAGEISALKKEDFLPSFLRRNRIESIIDASHPFDKYTTEICVKIAELENIKFRKFIRPSWKPKPNDNWITLPTLNKAEKIIPHGSNVFIATGRSGLENFLNLLVVNFT
jgi:precorrin-6A/cobalt-precorrin-6A reductase